MPLKETHTHMTGGFPTWGVEMTTTKLATKTEPTVILNLSSRQLINLTDRHPITTESMLSQD